MIGCWHRSARSLVDIALRSRRRFDHVFVSSAARVLTFLIGLLMGWPRIVLRITGLLMGRPWIILRITHRDRFAPRITSGFFWPRFGSFFSRHYHLLFRVRGQDTLLFRDRAFLWRWQLHPPRRALFWAKGF